MGWADSRILAPSLPPSPVLWALVSSSACGHGGLGLVEVALGGVEGRGLAPLSSVVNTISKGQQTLRARE